MIDTASAELSRPNQDESKENSQSNNAESEEATNDGDNDSDELVIPDGPETQVQSGVIDSGME